MQTVQMKVREFYEREKSIESTVINTNSIVTNTKYFGDISVIFLSAIQ